MAYITREDGERFVIPSYRDVLTVKQKAQLKREILLLSQNYGEYITLQKKNATQYEVAFSTDTGYLLGESIWHYFRKPLDMVYCEAIPNTSEAILVIVKAGGVYLDGRFPLDSIPEELIIFLTQQNNFEIYIYGDVPISETHQPGKFSFEPNSIKSFNVLEKPIFPSLPLLKIYQLQLVDSVLKGLGIGVFPVRRILLGIIAIGLIWMLWSIFTEKKVVVQFIPTSNPYQNYFAALQSPDPANEIRDVLRRANILLTMPGWNVNSISYSKGKLYITVTSLGGRLEDLQNWSEHRGAQATIQPNGVSITMPVSIPPNRVLPTHIYAIQDILASLIDKVGAVYPGNHMKLGTFNKKGPYTDVTITLSFENISPTLLVLIGDQFKDLPIVLQNVTFTVVNGDLTGSLIIDVLGN